MKKLNTCASQTPQFRIRNATLLCALAAAFPLAAQASAGVAQFTAGPVSVSKPPGSAVLTKGGAVDSGETIITGPDGRAQLRFSDGGLVSLAPNSQFRIDNYADVNDAKADKFLVNLLQGGMRAITGLIGKRNRDNYKVQTATATIGIRGSAFSLGYNPDGSLAVTTELDGIEVCTQAGCIGLTAGESARVTAADLAPVRTNSKTSLPIPAPRREPQVVGDQTNSTGSSLMAVVNVPTPAPSPVPPGPAPAPAPAAPPPATPPPPPPPASTNLTQNGWAIRTADLITPNEVNVNANTSAYRAADNGTYTSSTTGTPLGYQAGQQRYDWNTGDGAANDVRFTDTAIDPSRINPFMVMGYRMPAAYFLDGNTQPNTAVSTFVTGAIATPAQIDTLATSLPTARYNLVSSTPVFSTNPNTAVSAANGGLVSTNSYITVDFTGAGNYLTFNLNPLFNPSALPAADVTLRGSGVANPNGTFSGTLATTSAACNTGADTCQPGQVQGFFSGPAAAPASYIGLTYGGSTTVNGQFVGAGVFGGNPQAVANGPDYTVNSPNYSFSYAYNEASGVGNVAQYTGLTDTTLSVTQGQFLNRYQWSGDNDDSFVFTRDATQFTATRDQRGSIGRYGDANFIGWGSWALSTRAINGAPAENLNNVHFLVATPATGLSAFVGTGQVMNYKLIGGTNPTATGFSGESTITGNLNRASLQIDYTSIPVVNASVTVAFNATELPTASVAGMPLTISNGSFSTSGSSSTNRFSGTVSGPGGQYGGFVYSFQNPTFGNVRGTAIFQR